MFDSVEKFPDAKQLKGVQRVANPSFNSKKVLKRALDIVLASAMLILFAPLLLLITIVILSADGRRPIFAHVRVGKNGKAFKCLKFRTMVVDADKVLEDLLASSPELAREWAETRKLKKDPRILPVVGKLLRETSLDELPQIINVLRGDMSLVGPRPVVEEELIHYGSAKALYLSVRPGLTGPWQIGNRSNDTYENRVRQDIDYVLNQGTMRDLRIILKTAKMLVNGRAPGAY